ncbi:uncharacterized protein LOC134288385 [Aedes albopictus]|uniref:CCHC-type domain-containing protein n=1 Tax=Aedes albopictus TaxID=7160 RepID=A0ABM1ZYT9_AEDAL
MEDQLFKLPPFECDNVPITELRQSWFDYKRQFEYIAAAMSKKSKKRLKTRLKSIFLAVAGRQLQRVYESLPNANHETTEDGGDDFENVIQRLDTYFAPKRHDTFERHAFWTQKPVTGETLDKFLLRAKVLATKCQFGTTERESRDAAVIDKIVMLAPPELRRKILEKPNINLDELTNLVNTHLSIQHQVRELNQHASSAGNMLETSRGSTFVNKISNTNDKSRWTQSYQVSDCSRCGNRPHKPEENCPAKNVKCHNCDAIGHFAKKCRGRIDKSGPKKRKSTDYQDHRRFKKPKINAVSANQLPESRAVKPEAHPQDSFIYAISDNHDELVWCKVGGVLIEMMVDSGSKYNIVDESTWQYIRNKNAFLKNVRPSSKQLSAYAQRESLSIICTFDAEITVVEGNGLSVDTTFYVVKGGEQNLLGRVTSKQLGVLLIGLPSAVSPEEIQHISDNAIDHSRLT